MNAIFAENRVKLLLDLKNILEFVRKYDKDIFIRYSDLELLDIFSKHILYGTFIVLYDEIGIFGIERYNIINDRLFLSIDTVIRPDKRCLRTIKQLMKKGVEESPYCKTLKFVIYEKGQRMNLGYRVHEIDKFLGNGEYKLNIGGRNA